MHPVFLTSFLKQNKALSFYQLYTLKMSNATNTITAGHKLLNGYFAKSLDVNGFIARAKLHEMANKLSIKASDDYLKEIIKHLRQVEVKHLGSQSHKILLEYNNNIDHHQKDIPFF